MDCQSLHEAFYEQVILGRCPMIVCDKDGDVELIGYIPTDQASHAALYEPHPGRRVAFLISLARHSYRQQELDAEVDAP
jgi:hypothetical protein